MKTQCTDPHNPCPPCSLIVDQDRMTNLANKDFTRKLNQAPYFFLNQTPFQKEYIQFNLKTTKTHLKYFTDGTQSFLQSINT